MILHLGPDSPALVRAAATSVLILHISAGSVGILSGATALLARKGARLHRTAGNVFFVSMLIMSAIGACVAPFFPDRISALVGVLTFYLVATGWASVKRAAAGFGFFDIGALVVVASAAVALLTLGLHGMNSPGGLVDIDGQPYQAGFAFGALAALAAILDIRVILGGGIFDQGRIGRRIARHLWRLCVALFIAASSLFLGQPQVFPAPLRGSPILFAPEIAILGLMIFWLLRVRFTNALKLGAPGRGAPAGRMGDHHQAEGRA
jgi:uncharacterized membrane protein